MSRRGERDMDSERSLRTERERILVRLSPKMAAFRLPNRVLELCLRHEAGGTFVDGYEDDTVSRAATRAYPLSDGKRGKPFYSSVTWKISLVTSKARAAIGIIKGGSLPDLAGHQ